MVPLNHTTAVAQHLHSWPHAIARWLSATKLQIPTKSPIVPIASAERRLFKSWCRSTRCYRPSTSTARTEKSLKKMRTSHADQLRFNVETSSPEARMRLQTATCDFHFNWPRPPTTKCVPYCSMNALANHPDAGYQNYWMVHKIIKAILIRITLLDYAEESSGKTIAHIMYNNN